MVLLFAGLMAAVPTPLPPIHYAFAITRAEGTIYNPWTFKEDKVRLRSYVGSGARPGDFVAPTIRVAPGQHLTIDLDNKLEPCTASQLKSDLCFNDTNLHTHGMWVSPSGHSDNVLVSIAPGQQFRYEYDVPVDHPAGTFWYHPHRHGNGDVQVGSGMAGALIVTGNRPPTRTAPGDIDILLKDSAGRPISERTLIFQHISYGCLNSKGIPAGKRDLHDEPIAPFTCKDDEAGAIENFETDWDWVHSGRFTGVNGKVEPTLGPATTGSFERWRLINAGTGESMRMTIRHLDPAAPALRSVGAGDQADWLKKYCTGAPVPLWQIALDGLTRSEVRRTPEAVLFAGERMDVVVRFPEPGSYCVFNDTSRNNPDGVNPSRMVALVEAIGPAPPQAASDVAFRSMLVDAARRSLADPVVRQRVVGDLGDGLKLAAFVWHKTIVEKEVSGYREVIVNVLDVPGDDKFKFRMNGRSYEDNRIDAVLPLGRAEEWQLAALSENHPLHIHVNPFQIVSIKDVEGHDLTDPKSPFYDPDYAGLIGQWKDTVMVKENARVAFRTRYERFTGDFVTHCHIMYHGDHGMMQNLRIAAQDGEADSPHHSH